jgi:hypothetical protein
MLRDEFNNTTVKTRSTLRHAEIYLQNYFTSWYPGDGDRHAKLGQIVQIF